MAIIGSCITRDLWPIRGAALRDVLYISRTSLPSLFSPAPAGLTFLADPPEPLKRHQHNALLADLQKTAIARLVAFRPTHLIFDFIDERFDLLAMGDSLVTHSWELAVSGYMTQPPFARARRVPRLSEAGARLWRQGATELAALIRATPLRESRLILHTARWATHRLTAEGAAEPILEAGILPGLAADIGEHNALLAEYDAAFEAVMPPLQRIEAPEHRLASDTHPWGFSPFHYVAPYYVEIWRQLEALGVRREAPVAA